MATVYKSIFTGPEIDAKLSERVPSTPSGSPLHDLFVAAGAVWDNGRFRDGYFQQCDDQNIQSVTQCIE